MFREAEHGAQAGAQASELVLDPAPSPERIARVLGAYGFADPQAAYRELERMARDVSRFGLVSPRTRAVLASVAPRLLARVAATTEPDRTLSRLERTVATLGAKGAFYRLLHDDDEALELFVRLAADSPFLNEQFRRNPGLADEVVDLLRTGVRLDRDEALARMRASEGDRFEAIRAVQRTGLLLVGLRDLAGRASGMAVARELTGLAEAVLVRLAELVLEEERERAGPLPAGVRFVLFGLGSLGGRALGYGSDLDLVACCDMTGAADPLAVHERMERVGRRLVERLRTLGLYRVDLRLRPEGSAGHLVCSAEALERYYAEPRAQVWERLAATRMRPVAGDLERGALLLERVHAALYRRPIEGLAAHTRAMRARLEAAARGRWDLKRMPGGLLDIDFLAAYLRLRERGEPEAARDPATLEALRALSEAGALPAQASTELLSAYAFLRTLELRLQLAEGRSVHTLPDAPAARRRLARSLGYADTRRYRAEEALQQELEHTRRTVRGWFDRLVARSSTG
ncbi:MAG: hypothetical protein D6776_04980 [Planctomycetota bacterium]|nr:MAG: hypothetical protein D6776_04980 [Planctomycetota bacterium]